MIFQDIIKCEIQEFKNILYKNIFNKYDIEEFLKNNMVFDIAYVREIEKYINEKYKNEINLYLELAKYYLNKDINKSIKYLEQYMANGGQDQAALMLLIKLYRDIGNLKKVFKIVKNIKFNNNREKIEEIFRICIELDSKSPEFKRNFKRIIIAANKYTGKDKNKLVRHMLIKIFKKNTIQQA